jgi:hypothetical protein
LFRNKEFVLNLKAGSVPSIVCGDLGVCHKYLTPKSWQYNSLLRGMAHNDAIDIIGGKNRINVSGLYLFAA